MTTKPPLRMIHGAVPDADVVVTPEDEAESAAYAAQLHDWLMAAWKRDGPAIGLQLLEPMPDGRLHLDEMQLLP
jgi:hypothetical protein